MAGFLDFLGGAAGAYAQVKTEDRQRQQIEAYNARLREQELQDYEAKEKIKQRLNAGQPINNPTLNPATGQYNWLAAGGPGEAPSLQSSSEVPGVREAYEAERAFEAEKQALDLALAEGKLGNLEYERAYKQAATSAAQARAFASSQAGSLSAAKRENPERYMRSGAASNPRNEAFVEDRAIADAAAAEGLTYDPRSRQIFESPDVPVSAERRNSIMSTATKGRSASNPVDVASEAEANSLPPGTYIRFRGQIGVVE